MAGPVEIRQKMREQVSETDSSTSISDLRWYHRDAQMPDCSLDIVTVSHLSPQLYFPVG